MDGGMRFSNYVLAENLKHIDQEFGDQILLRY